MRFGYTGSLRRAHALLGPAKHELYRLRERMLANGLAYGHFRRRLDNNGSYLIGYILPTGLEAVHIVAAEDEAEIQPGAEGFAFEFATSGFPIIKRSVNQEKLTFDAYDGAIVLVDLTTAKESGETIVRATPRIAFGRRFIYPETTSPLGRLFHPALSDAPLSYPFPGERYREILYRSTQPSNPHTGVFINSYNDESALFGESGYENIDDAISLTAFVERYPGIDIPFVRGEGTETVNPEYLRGAADWPRANGIQTTEGRSFAIYVDASNKFHVYPLGSASGVDGIKQNVDQDLVKTIKPELPSDMFAPDRRAIDTATDTAGTARWIQTQPDLQWHFHPDGAKACCVMHTRIAQGAGGLVGALSTPPNNDGDFVYGGQLYAIGISVVEVTIKIEVTGTGPQEFSVGSSVRVVRDAKTTTRCTFNVDYAAVAIPDLKVEVGDLLALDIERWYQPDKSIPDPTYPGPGNWFLAGMHTGQKSIWISQWRPEGIDAGDSGETVDFGTNWLNRYTLQTNSLYDYFTSWDTSRGSYPDGPKPNDNMIPSPLPFVTGNSRTFFALRKLGAGAETQLRTIVGDTILGCDLKTASVAVGLERIEYTTKVCKRASGFTDYKFENPETRFIIPFTYPAPNAPDIDGDDYTLPTTTTMRFRTAHPAVAIHTLGAWRKTLLPEGMDEQQRVLMEAYAKGDPAVTLADGYIYLPYNDRPTWEGKEDLREYLRNDGRPYNTDNYLYTGRVTVADINWWLAGIHASNDSPLHSDKPHCGWYAYTSELLHRNKISGHTTFFVHPHGIWAFFDQQQIYNRYGSPAINEDWSEDNIPTIQNSNLNKLWVKEFSYPWPAYAGPYEGSEGPYGVEGPADRFMYEAPAVIFDSTGHQLSANAAIRQLKRGSAPSPMVLGEFVVIQGLYGRQPAVFRTYTFVHHPDPIARAWQNLWDLYEMPFWHDGFSAYDTMSGLLETSEPVQHVVYDHVHFEIEEVALDTSFRQLYNEAVAALPANSDLEPIEPNDLRATVVVESPPMPLAAFNDFGGPAARLSVTFPAEKGPWYNFDAVYHDPFQEKFPSYPPVAGAMFRPSLATGFYTDTDQSGFAVPLQQWPITFSSCLLIKTV